MTEPCVICGAFHVKKQLDKKMGSKFCKNLHKKIGRRNYERNKRRTDPKYRLDQRIRLQLRRDLKNINGKTSKNL